MNSERKQVWRDRMEVLGALMNLGFILFCFVMGTYQFVISFHMQGQDALTHITIGIAVLGVGSLTAPRKVEG